MKSWKKFLALSFALITLISLSACSSTAAPIEDPADIVSADWSKGSVDSKVLVMEFGDFQCPACAAYYGLVEQITNEYKDKVQFVYRHFPLTQIHPYALPASQVAEAAGKQGKFWEMYAVLFERQNEWTNGDSEEKFVSYATDLGLNIEQFNADRKSKEVKDKIRRDMKTGSLLQVGGTPTFFVNGTVVPNPSSIEGFRAILDAALAEAKNTPQTTTPAQ